jgi:hypothetical protein
VGVEDDLVDVSEVMYGITVNLSVELPCYDLDGETGYEALVVEGLGKILGLPQQVIPKTGWLRPRKAFKEIVLGLPNGLVWLDEFNTPKKCLEQLCRGLKPSTSPAFRDVHAYLSMLPSALEYPACITDVVPIQENGRLF